MDAEDDRDQLNEIIKSHCVQLAEHFDTVQILCTKRESSCTHSFCRGEGNLFARYGHAREWVMIIEEDTKEGIRRAKD